MGWLRLVGSLKLQVSFAEYRLFYRALLQKIPIILRILLLVATPQQNDNSLLKNAQNSGPFCSCKVRVAVCVAVCVAVLVAVCVAACVAEECTEFQTIL